MGTPSPVVTCRSHRIDDMQAQRETPITTLRQIIARRSVGGLEYAVLLCLVLIAILAESGLLGGAFSLLP